MMIVRLAILVLLICIVERGAFRLRESVTGSRRGARNYKCTLGNFDAYGLPIWLKSACSGMGYHTPTDVQSLALPVIFAGKDTVLQAHTGSGKTLTYALPVLLKVDPSRAAIQAVVVVPTRELGFQVASVLKQLSAGSPQPIVIMPVVDGSKNRRQALWAAAEPPHIVVGNPTSLLRLVDEGKLRLNAVDMVVVDEVDACLIEHDTRQELHNLLTRHLSSTYGTSEDELQEDLRESRVYRDLARDHVHSKYRLQRQTIMCSATIPQRQHFAVHCFKNGWTATLPELINVSQDELVPTQVRHEYVHCAPEMRRACLLYLLRTEFTSTANESSTLDQHAKQAIVFVQDADDASAVSDALTKGQSSKDRDKGTVGHVFAVGVLVENMSLDARAKTVADFRKGVTNVLVCSELGARGLDLPNTSLVIQMRLPDRVEPYIHRAGRTGRLGRAGKVITLTSPEEDFVVRRFSNDIGVPIVERKLKVKV